MPKKKKRGPKPRPKPVTNTNPPKHNEWKKHLPLIAVWTVVAIAIIAVIYYVTKTPETDLNHGPVVTYLNDNGELQSSAAEILQYGDTIQFKTSTETVTRSNLDVIIEDIQDTGYRETDEHWTFHINRFDVSGATKDSPTIDRIGYHVEPDPNCENNPGLIIYGIDRIYYVAEQYVTFDNAE